MEAGGQTVFPFGKPLESQNTTVPEELDALFTPGEWEHDMVQKCYRKAALTPKTISRSLHAKEPR